MAQVAHTGGTPHTKDGEVYQRSQLSCFMGKIEGRQTPLYNILHICEMLHIL